MKTKLLLIKFALALTVVSTAQNKYTFTKITGHPYSDLVGDKNVSDSFDVNTGLYLIPGLNGETFDFFDLSYTFGGLKTISVGEGPFLRVDNDSSLVIVDVAFTYIDSIDPTSKISYVIEGASGQKILKTQYKNYKLRYGPGGNFINVQIWYYQQNGVIELHYGSRSTNNASGYNTVQGPNIGIFYSPDDFSGCYEKLWCTGSPAAMTLDSATNYVFNAMSGIPDEGTIYRFSPRITQTVSTVGITENTKREWHISPNPVNDHIFISGTKQPYILTMYDLNGRKVRDWRDQTGDTTLDVSELAPGCYFLELTQRSGVQRRKVIIAR